MVSDKPSPDSTKKDSTCRRVITDLSWPLPPSSSINGGIPKDTYLSVPKRMRLPSAMDFASLIRRAGRGAWLFICDVSRAPLDLADWPLMCFQQGGRYFMDASMPFGLR